MLTPHKFLQIVDPLVGRFPTIKLKDHYTNSLWMDELATILLRRNDPNLWLLDLDGVSPPQEAIHDRLRA